MKYINKLGDIVTLLPNTATNIYGNKLLWVKRQNGSITSIWEHDFNSQFKECG